jgi:diguanylate cyclase (GGDEF)-like protein
LVRDRLAHAVVRARGAGDGVTAVVFVDLDDFKQVNDILGHAAGDAVLVEVAGRLRALVRSEDLVGRLAGDEFVVVCRLADRDRDVRALAERIGAALAVPVVAGDREVTVSASVGVAFLDPDVGADVLLERADAAMYRSKDAGKATYRLAAPDGTIILP